MTAVAVSSSRMRHRLDVVQNPTADADAPAPLAHDVEPRVRFAYAALLTDFGRRVPAGVPEVLAGDAHPGVRRLVTGCPELPPAVQRRLVEDEDPGVRAGMLSPELWERLAAPVRERLLDDPPRRWPCGPPSRHPPSGRRPSAAGGPGNAGTPLRAPSTECRFRSECRCDVVESEP